MATDTTYNGWTNYETWNVKLWIDNESGSYGYWREVAQQCYDDADANKTFTREENATHDLRERLKDEYETAMHDWLDESGRSASVWADLLGAALSEVNWQEIAVSMIEETKKETDGDETDE